MAVTPVITPADSEIFLSWAQIVEPNADDAEVDAGKYVATVWFSKDDQNMHDQVMGLVDAAIKDNTKWKGEKPKAKFRDFEFIDGDQEFYENAEGEEVCAQPNRWGFRVKTSRKPIVKDRYGNDVTDQSMIGFHPQVQMKYSSFGYDNKFGKGITFSPDVFKIIDFGQAGSSVNDDDMGYDNPTED